MICPQSRAQARLRDLRRRRARRRREPAGHDHRPAQGGGHRGHRRGHGPRPLLGDHGRARRATTTTRSSSPPTPRPARAGCARTWSRACEQASPPARSSTWWWTSTPTRTSATRTLVVANQTVGGQPLIDQLKELAEEGQRRFIVISPQSGEDDGRRRRAPGAHARAARGGGPEGDRPGHPPRPLHRDPERARLLRHRRDRDLHLPRDALGLAARRPRRPRADLHRQARAPRGVRRRRRGVQA